MRFSPLRAINAGRGPGCLPPENEGKWQELAAGLIQGPEAEALLDHVGGCGYCGKLLREATELMATETTDEEEALVDGLASSQPDWQKALAHRLAQASTAEEPAAVTVTRGGWLDRLRLPVWAYGVPLTAAFSVIASVFAWPAWQLHRVNELSLEAYVEKRQIDFRLPGAPYSPVRRERGAGGDRPAALAEAESIAASQLDSHPDDPQWLAARGRVDLLGGAFTKAIEGLERSLAGRPDAEATEMDLAAAYYQRAQSGGRVEDHQKAYDLLSKILSKNPENAAALYNRALSAQGWGLRDKAAEDWHHYLKLDSSSPWADEARWQLRAPKVRDL